MKSSLLTHFLLKPFLAETILLSTFRIPILFTSRRFMNDRTDRVAWNAAYWLLRSEARRQIRSRYPDCNWHLVEAHDECVATIIEAQARVCFQAMTSTADSPASSISSESAVAFETARS